MPISIQEVKNMMRLKLVGMILFSVVFFVVFAMNATDTAASQDAIFAEGPELES